MKTAEANREKVKIKTTNILVNRTDLKLIQFNLKKALAERARPGSTKRALRKSNSAKKNINYDDVIRR
jgi:hypothetical protein